MLLDCLADGCGVTHLSKNPEFERRNLGTNRCKRTDDLLDALSGSYKAERDYSQLAVFHAKQLAARMAIEIV
jgi:hypothetical protein